MLDVLASVAEALFHFFKLLTRTPLWEIHIVVNHHHNRYLSHFASAQVKRTSRMSEADKRIRTFGGGGDRK